MAAAIPSPFELLELPDGRCYVARPAASEEMTLVAGSFAIIQPAEESASNPVGLYGSRDEAERAIQRAEPSSREPLAPFAAWMRKP